MDEKKDFKSDLERYDRLENKAEREIEKVRKQNTLFITIFGLLVAFASFLFFSSISDVKDNIKEDIGLFKKQTELKTEIDIDKLKEKYEDEIESIKNDIEKEIESEFQRDNIVALVERKARERIDLVADNFIDEQIEKRISERIRTTQNQLDYMKYKITETAAFNDDRLAYDSLRTWSNSREFRFNKNAQQAVSKIIIEYSSEIPYLGPTYIVGSSKGSNDYSIEQLKRFYLNAPKETRKDVLEILYSHKDISTDEKIPFFISVIKSDRSLEVVADASKWLSRKMKLDFKPLEIDGILKWYESYKKGNQ